LSSPSDEQILAQEQGVIKRSPGLRSELQTAVDVSGSETEGTLILTNQRLLYVHGGEHREDIPTGSISEKAIYFTDVEDLDDIPSDPANLTIWLSSITKVAGHHAPAMAPKLEVNWDDRGVARTAEFVEQVTGSSRKKNLNDWASVIERLKAGTVKVTSMATAPDAATLEGRVLRALDDMQEKGLLTLESELEDRYKVELEPEDVEAACEKLVSQGLVKKTSSKDEPPFYQKPSPLGKDSLDD
jgi:hypothetical protein